MSSKSPSVLYIVGPTATGKTQLAISIAQHIGGEIVNADSRQVYRYMDIGTAKPTPEERARIPHHLFDLLTPAEGFSLGTFLNLAREAIEGIRLRGSTPIVVGGTGQYLWALRDGWEVPAVPPDGEYRAELETLAAVQGSQILYQRLRFYDPKRASEIDPRNVRRVIRALEILHVTGMVPSALQADSGEGVEGLVIGLTMDREILYERIDRRVDSMMADGFLDEARELVGLGFTLGQGNLACPGYKELGQYLDGKITLDEAVRRTKFQTHRLARRQYTWFKLNDPRINWLDGLDLELTDSSLNLVSQLS
jgi:tRNA dimethylallyltransferase